MNLVNAAMISPITILVLSLFLVVDWKKEPPRKEQGKCMFIVTEINIVSGFSSNLSLKYRSCNPYPCRTIDQIGHLSNGYITVMINDI